MTFGELVPWLIPSLAGVLALALVLGVLRSEYRAKPPILVATSSGRLLPFGAVGAPSSLWYARIIGPRREQASANGILVVSDGTLSFRGERESNPAWRFPIPDLVATQRSPGRGNDADIELKLPDGRQLDLVVSKTKIRRRGFRIFSALAQGDHAHVLVSLLAANGARCRRQ